MLIYVLCLLLLVLYIALIGFYAYHYNKVDSFSSATKVAKIFVSVIIPARNEAENIAACLEAILQQNYPTMLLDIIVVDDQSTDATASIVANQFPSVQLISIPLNTTSSKKNALQQGIEKAKGTLIVCTDADTIAPKNWITTIALFYDQHNAAFIACPVKLKPKNKSWNAVTIFQVLDFLTLQGITAASVNNGFHMMSNGANMAFTKAAFIAVDGFKNIDNIATGDDMLLMQKIKDKFPSQVFYLKSKEAIVTSQTVTTWKDFFIQRIRWSSKATYYTDKKLIYTLLLVYCINVASFILLVSLFFTTQNWVWVFLFFIIKSLVEFHFFKKISTYFNQQFLNKYFFLFIPVHIVYIIIAGWFGKFGKVKWKGRTV